MMPPVRFKSNAPLPMAVSILLAERQDVELESGLITYSAIAPTIQSP